MTDEDLNTWNHRFCPVCRAEVGIVFNKHDDGSLQVIRSCTENCGYRTILTPHNITDNDRHKIIETFFGYNKPFYIDDNRLRALVLNKLLFPDIRDFLQWFVYETSRYNALNHIYLPVSSTYWLIVKRLWQYLSVQHAGELRDITRDKSNIGNVRFLRENSGVKTSVLYSRRKV